MKPKGSRGAQKSKARKPRAQADSKKAGKEVKKEAKKEAKKTAAVKEEVRDAWNLDDDTEKEPVLLSLAQRLAKKKETTASVDSDSSSSSAAPKKQMTLDGFGKNSSAAGKSKSKKKVLEDSDEEGFVMEFSDNESARNNEPPRIRRTAREVQSKVCRTQDISGSVSLHDTMKY